MGQICGAPEAEAKDRELVFDQAPVDVVIAGEHAVAETPSPPAKKPANKTDLIEALDKVARRTGYEQPQGSSQRKALPKRERVSKLVEKETGRKIPDQGFDFDDESDGEDRHHWSRERDEVERQDGDSVADDAEEQLAEIVHYTAVDKEVDREQAEAAHMTEEEFERRRLQAESKVMESRAAKDYKLQQEAEAAEAAFDEA
eukprot:Hpha_TRINITY_DN15624_c2_g1::TRINITY_DN15624_c2_g1_i1::g.99208::m.99208